MYASIPISEWLTKNARQSGKVRKNQSDTLLAVGNPADLAVEAIRGLRTSLHFAMMEAKKIMSLMISGASPAQVKLLLAVTWQPL